jgi:release factor glutamine methyltransferase
MAQGWGLGPLRSILKKHHPVAQKSTLAFVRTHRLMKNRPSPKGVEPTPPFDRLHAERELERASRAAKIVSWTDPTGRAFDVHVPPTVYPPREDTDLLAEVVGRTFPRPGATWLEIGCGSGVLSLFAARNGCRVTACDINPFAAAATRALLAAHGHRAEVFEGGPGPREDGELAQWGGDRLYDTVVWNLPYLPAPPDDSPHLGPLEEAGLIDTDRVGLFERLMHRMADGGLIHAEGVAYLVLSSSSIGNTAQERAWACGLAARVVAERSFGDGERLSVVQVWRPYTGGELQVKEEVASTNGSLLSSGAPAGSSLRALRQTEGRGQRGRTWDSLDNAFLASWAVEGGAVLLNPTQGQVQLGAAMVRLFRHLKRPDSAARMCMKWPNDLYVSAGNGTWKKAAGLLMEGVTRGNSTTTVVGVGVNTAAPNQSAYGGLASLGIAISLEELHGMLHALVASVFEMRGLAGCDEANRAVVEEVLLGESVLGPIFYRGDEKTVQGLTGKGELLFSDGGTVDDGNLLTWSNI